MREPIECDYCDLPIAEGIYYAINGDYICEGCTDRHFKKEVNPNE